MAGDWSPDSLDPVQIIACKRDGGTLKPQQIAAFLSGYLAGEVPDYQMAALAMAILLRGMEPSETAALTEQMLHSGIVLQWPRGFPPRVDKHSTGGVGDKVSLVLAPLLACCELAVPMISGRGLGFTGGTLDKLESIPGFRTDLSVQEIQSVVERVGCVITGATDQIAPADRKLYALRDVTATVPSIPLITASIMSKKLAEGLDALVLDVKVGTGAVMQSMDKARALAHSLVETGRQMGVEVAALLSDMNQPLGRKVGNAVEVDEAVQVLSGGGPPDLIQLTLALGSLLLEMAGRAETTEEAHEQLRQHLASGRAREKLAAMVRAQGGDLDAPRPVAPARDLPSDRAGWVGSIDTAQLGRAVVQLGGGRRVLSDQIDHTVGLEMLVRLGDRVDAGSPLVRLFAPGQVAERVAPTVLQAITIQQQPATPPPLIVERIHPQGS